MSRKPQFCDVCREECGQRRQVSGLYLVNEKQLELCHPCHDELRFIINRAESPFFQAGLEAGKKAAKDWYFAKGALKTLAEVQDAEVSVDHSVGSPGS